MRAIPIEDTPLRALQRVVALVVCASCGHLSRRSDITPCVCPHCGDDRLEESA